MANDEGDLRLVARCENYLARQHESMLPLATTTDAQKLEHLTAAHKHLQTALSIVRKLPDEADRIQESRILNNLGSLHRYLQGNKSFHEAKAYFNSALEIDRRLGDSEGQARSHNNIAAGLRIG